MSEKETSQAQQSWKKVDSWMEEWAKIEAKSNEQMQQAIEESARLARESLAYGMKLSAEWRKLGLETLKRTSNVFSQGFGGGFGA
jgi:hypothetical protein